MPDSLPRRGFLAACASGLAAGCLGSPPAYEPSSAGVWPMSRYDPGGTSHVPDAPGPRTNPTEQWSRQTFAMFRPPAYVVRGDTLYFGSGSRFHALNTATGDARWSLHEGAPWYGAALAAAPAYGDVMPVVATRAGYAAFSPSGGVNVLGFRRSFEERWTRTTVEADDFAELLGFSLRSPPPVVADGTLYTVASGDRAAVVAIDAATGTTQWTTPVERASNARVAVAGGRVFVPTFGNGLHALDAASGEHLWCAPTRDARVYPPTATDDAVYVHDRGFVYAFDPESGDQRWVVEAERVGTHGMRTALTATDSLVYTVGDVEEGRAVFAFDADTGDLRWRRIGGTQEVPPVVAGDTLYAPGDVGLRALDAETGDQLWTHGDDRVGGLAVVGSTAYVTTTGGLLYALEGSA